MAETLTVVCDRCRKAINTPKRNRTRIRWSREDGFGPTDYCLDCAADLQVFLRIRAEGFDRKPAAQPRRPKPTAIAPAPTR